MTRIIEISGLSKHYRMGNADVPALTSVSLDVAPGEFVALSGPSGSGKTTLLNICGLLDRADTGEYRLDGVDVTSLSNHERTRRRRSFIGFVFQHFNLVPVLTAYDNVEYPLLLERVPAAQRAARVNDMLEQVGLTGFARHLPDRLSGGQRQRVAIARALVKRPALVVADEPTANLDTATAKHVIDLMHRFAAQAGTTFLVSTHDIRITARCDRVVHLVDGRILTREADHEMADVRV